MLINLLDLSSFHYVEGDWTNANKSEVYRNLIPTFRQLDTDSQPRELSMLKNLQMYTMVHHTNVFSAFRLFDRQAIDPQIGSRLVWNLVRSAADTVAAKISKNRIKTMLVTDGADWLMQRKAEKLDRATYAVMFNGNFHKAAKKAFRDSEICGTGIIQAVANPDKMRVDYERVLPFEVFVDEVDAMYGTPTRFYRYRIMGKGELVKKFPKHEEQIKGLRSYNMVGGVRVSDSCLVFESWYLDEKDGRHCICAEGFDLLDEKHDDTVPFIFMRWSDAPIGFWGTSLADEISPFQLEVNKILYYMQKSMQLGHAPKWFITPNSIPKSYINNAIGTVIPVNGQDPRYFAPAPMHPQVIEYVQMMKNEAYAFVGISQLSARAQKPAGLDSGKALQTYNDIESERFVLLGQSFEEFHIDAFKATVRECKKIAAVEPKFEVLADSPFGFEKINWNDIDMDESSFMVKPYPISALPQQPEARFDFLQKQLDAQLITPEEFAELNDMPDLKTQTRMKYASYFAAKDNVERIMGGKEAISPEKYDKLSTCLSVAVNSYLFARQRGAPEERLSALRDYIDEIQTLIPEPPAPPTPPVAVPPGAPMGVAA